MTMMAHRTVVVAATAATRSGTMRLKIALAAIGALLSLGLIVKLQIVQALQAPVEPAGDGDLPEDCDHDQYFDLALGRCQNCSDVLRIFEPFQQDPPAWQSTASSASGNQNNYDATSLAANQSGRANGNNNNNSWASQLMRLTQRLPQLNSNKSRAGGTTAQPAPVGLPSRRPPKRPGSAATDAILSRLVVKPQAAVASETAGVEEEEAAPETGASPPDLALELLTGELDQVPAMPPNGGAPQNRLHLAARAWQKLLIHFLHSNEAQQMNLPEAVRQCKLAANGTACQMWANVCVLTQYAHTSESGANRRLGSPSSSSSSSATLRSRQRTASSTSRSSSGSVGDFNPRFSWQQCARFSLSTICNSLRDWHQFEKQQAQLAEVNDIFADEDEMAATLQSSEPGGLKHAHSLVMQLGQPIQLLAYKYALDGQLLEVSQFNWHDLRRSFCALSGGAKLARSFSAHDKLRFGDNLNLFLDTTDQLSLDGDQDQDQDELLGQLRVGQEARLACKFSPLEANLFARDHANETHFVDLFMAQPSASGSMSLKPVPVLVKNLIYNNQLVNARHAQDPSRWKLVHRFFSQATLKMANAPQQQQQQQQQDLENELLVYAKAVDLELNFRRQHERGLVISSLVLKLEYDYLPLIRSDLRRQLQQRSRSLLYNDTTGEQADLGGGSGGANTKFKTAPNLSLGEKFRKQTLESLIQVDQSLGDMLAFKKDFDLFLTILCLISCIWSLIRCYNIQKYQGYIKLDIYSLMLFLIISCDIIANLILVVTLLFGLHLLLSIKFYPVMRATLGQLPVFAPSGELESTLLMNLQLALVFKLIGLAYKLLIRLKADIFFIDWERPKMLTSTQLMNHQAAVNRVGNQQQPAPPSASNKATHHHHHQAQQHQQQQQQQQQISFWRQYSIVNRWLQMQTMRRLNLTSQLLLFLLAGNYLPLEQLTTADASLRAAGPLNQHAQTSPKPDYLVQNGCFRAVVLAGAYLALAIVQVAYNRLLHEPMLRSRAREFIDLCSVANVSLFAMLYPRYGFYIHGRNANGSSECGIGEMNALLDREARDLCSKRGLVANTDQQTFVLVLPKIINDHYRKLLFRTSDMAAAAAAASSSSPSFLSSPPGALDGFQFKTALNLSGWAQVANPSGSLSRSMIETVVARNRAVNVFLINYLDHIYKDIDYSIRERRRFESFLVDVDLMGAGGDSDDEAPPSLANKPAASRAAALATINHSSLFMSANQSDNAFNNLSQQPQSATSGTFFVDHADSFTSLTWLGLEWDLILVELLVLLNLDLWLGGAHLPLTVGLIWLANKLIKLAYNACARNNLVVKSMLDEKFLNR